MNFLLTSNGIRKVAITNNFDYYTIFCDVSANQMVDLLKSSNHNNIFVRNFSKEGLGKLAIWLKTKHPDTLFIEINWYHQDIIKEKDEVSLEIFDSYLENLCKIGNFKYLIVGGILYYMKNKSHYDERFNTNIRMTYEEDDWVKYMICHTSMEGFLATKYDIENEDYNPFDNPAV